MGILLRSFFCKVRILYHKKCCCTIYSSVFVRPSAGRLLCMVFCNIDRSSKWQLAMMLAAVVFMSSAVMLSMMMAASMITVAAFVALSVMMSMMVTLCIGVKAQAA